MPRTAFCPNYEKGLAMCVKKWYNIIEKNIDYKITENANNRIAIRTNPFLIKIWNFIWNINLLYESKYRSCYK